MSQPRPIHQPHREIRSQPDEAEPSYSYEQESFLPFKEEDVEDDFHRRISSSRRESGGSFWRTGSANDSFGGPSFSSMSMKQRSESNPTTVGERRSGARLGAALQLHSQDSGEASQTPWAKPDGSSRTDSSSAGPTSGPSRESKKITKQRANARRMKLEAQNSDLDLGHIEDDNGPPLLVPPTDGSVSRSSSEHSGPLLYGKTLRPPGQGTLVGKTASLIFPTGVENPGEEESDAVSTKRRRINFLLDQCETVRFPFKKKLILEKLQLTATDIPVKDLCGKPLGSTLHKLSLSGNRLNVIPDRLVQGLPSLKHLDLSECDLIKLPLQWNLPQLKRLNLSHNRLQDFPDEQMLEGIPELHDLDMFGNKVSEIIIPRNPRLLSRLEILNLGYNDLVCLPDNLDQIRSLRTLKVMNNLLERVPMRVCEMDIKVIDVSSNPLIQPPIETCERGICSMRRYYECLRHEEQTKNKKVLEEVHKKLNKKQKKEEKGGKFRINRFFSSKSPSSSSNSVRSSFGEEVPVTRSVTTHSLEEPIRLPSKKDGGVLTRTRSASFDATLKGPKAKPLAGPPPREDSLENSISVEEALAEPVVTQPEDVAVNDTLKVIFVGMAMAGKTSMIKRLIQGKDAVIPKRDDRTIGVDIYEWDPSHNLDRPKVDTKVEMEDKELAAVKGDVDVKLSVWDFAGQHVYHATHELFFSSRALYVVVWDMGATNEATHRRSSAVHAEEGAFKLSYDSSDEEDDDDFIVEEEIRRADRALERDIDEKVQFWVECIQSCAPGAAILPVASFNDYFDEGEEEARRRCEVMKQRLLKHEERRIAGIKERLKEYTNENRANDEGALRLQKLLCSYTRPKLIFGSGNDSVVRVSGTKYTGFDHLTGRIVDLATGRYKAGLKYPVFRGHVGARIPRMRLQVRDAVREMRGRFKVVEWGYFISTLRERGLSNVEDISDALHFLTDVGELSYFGNVLPDRRSSYRMDPLRKRKESDAEPVRTTKQPQTSERSEDGAGGDDDDDKDDDYVFVVDDDDDDDVYDESNVVLPLDDTSATTRTTRDDGSLSTLEDLNITGLSQFVFLNPVWLVAAVACILRHDLDREIRETRRSFAAESRPENFYEANLNCPVITADDALLLWQAKKFTKKAAERAQQYSNSSKSTPFDFLQRLLVRFGVFVPIDLSIEKALLGGKEYARNLGYDDKPPSEIVEMRAQQTTADTPNYFFLPSLLGPGEPAEAWTYKNTDSWKVTLCHSVLFPDGVPPGLMERITASVLSSIYAVCKSEQHPVKILDGPLRVKEILCWRTAFFLKLGTAVQNDKGETKESVVEIFSHLADRDSHLCVGSSYMGAGMRRLIVSAKGQVGDSGRKIWNGGYMLVTRSISRVMSEYEGLEYEKQGFCPECLSKKAVSEASSWDFTVIRAAAQNGDDTMRCHHGHRIDTRLIAGPWGSPNNQKSDISNQVKFTDGGDPIVPVNDLLRGIVLVGLWDGRARKVVRVGSGFVVDRKRGLIVTASHTLMNIWGDKNTPFGEDYYGLREGKVVVGVIPRKSEGSNGDGTMALFRYFAKIVAKDPSIDEKGECHLDACVLRITTRLESDVGGNGDGCGNQPEILLLNNPDALKREKLQQLKVTDKCELDEQVRILGYNQGGEGLLGPGECLNRYVDFARGYVCKKFGTGDDSGGYLRHRFKPRAEIVVICPTIGGHSGGPCVNQQGEVIGILSRADPAENQRCYLVPAREWKPLVRRARNTL